MKKLLLCLIWACIGRQLLAQSVNDKVSIESNGTWYDGIVLKVDKENGKFFVHYDGWEEAFDEWVTPERLKIKKGAPLTKFKVGDKVEAEYGMIFEPATVIEVGENKYHIKFDNSLFGDKWLSENKIKKL